MTSFLQDKAVAAYQLFWSESFWMVNSSYTWNDVKGFPERKPLVSGYELTAASIFCCVSLLVIRHITESAMGVIGRYWNLRDFHSRRAVPNAVLEEEFQMNKKPSETSIEKLARELHYTTRYVHNWFARRRQVEHPTEMKRFKEAAWRGIYYSAAFGYGVWCLWDKSWLWDTSYCWKEYPQPVDVLVFGYYAFELGFYLSLCVTMYSDIRRKDFYEMFIHHIATIILLIFSFQAGFHRVGTLVLLVHDAADIIMELAKCSQYLGYQRWSNFMFIVFAIFFTGTRLGIFPFYIVRSIYTELPAEFGTFSPSVISLSVFLHVLILLHIFWFCLIVRMALTSIAAKNVTKDTRSETDELTSENEELDTSQGASATELTPAPRSDANELGALKRRTSPKERSD